MSDHTSTATENNTEEFHEVTPSDYEAMYNESREECERLKAVINSARLSPSTDHPAKDAKPQVTFERLTALLGTHGVNKLTRNELIASFGVDPASVDDAFLRKCFGRSDNGQTNDGKTAADLFKTSPLRYRQLKEVSKALRIFGAN